MKSAPVPDNCTCARFPAPSCSVNVPDAAPAATGVNTTDTVQLPPAPNDAPQVLFCENAPVMVIPAIAIALAVLFDTVNAWLALDVPSVWRVKLRAPVDNVS